MHPTRRTALVGLSAALVLFLASLAIILGGSFRPRQGVVALAGARLTDFRLPSLDSTLVDTSQMRGKVMVLCITDPPNESSLLFGTLGELYRNYESDPRVARLTVFRTPEPIPSVALVSGLRNGLAEGGLSSTSLLDLEGSVSRNFCVDRGSTLFVIDSGGTIRLRADMAAEMGERDGPRRAIADARQTIDSLLSASASLADERALAVARIAVPVPSAR